MFLSCAAVFLSVLGLEHTSVVLSFPRVIDRTLLHEIMTKTAVPNKALQRKYRAEYLQRYGAGRKKFRKLQKAVGVTVTRGRSTVEAKVGKHVVKAYGDGGIAYQTYRRWANRKKGAKKTRHNHKEYKADLVKLCSQKLRIC